MLDRAQSAQNPTKLVVRQEQSISSGKQDVANFSVRFQIAISFLEIGVKFLFANAAHDATSCAVPAVGCASISYEKQNAIRVAVNESRDRHVGIFPARVCHFER